MTRGAAVAKLYDGTHLGAETIVGTMTLLERARVPLTLQNLVAAAFTAYKAYDTSVDERVLFFQTHMVPGIEKTNLKADEMAILAAVGWVVPARTRLDCVRNLAHALQVEGLSYERAAVLALLVGESRAMTDDAYARVVLHAAALLAKPADVTWMAALPTAEVTREYILRWGLRVAEVGGPDAQGTKRKR